MSKLVKATLQKVMADEAETPDGEAFPVQFNPASLKIRLTNQIEGGRSTAKQVRQQTGNSSRTLSLELVFDTADEGSTDSPVSVRDKTKQLEQFISTPQNNPDPPPKLKFHWGDLTVVGIADSIDVSLEHFAANGFPLRAKVSLSIKEQDPTIVFKPADRGTGNAQSPGANVGLPGAGTNLGFSAGISVGAGIGLSAGLGVGAGIGISAGVGISADVKVGVALEGEMGAEFAARMGVEPTAWRGLETDNSSGSSLNAGSQVAFSSGLNTQPGVGTKSGVNAGSNVTSNAASGLNLSTQSQSSSSVTGLAGKSPKNADSAGKAMSSLGGIGATINALKFEKSQQQTSTSTAAFGLDLKQITQLNNPSAVSVSHRKSISRAPLVRTPNDSNEAENIEAIGQENLLDKRAMTFAQGIPLQPLFGVTRTQNIFAVYSHREQSITSHDQGVPFSSNATIPAWIALPQKDRVRQSIDSLSTTMFKPGHACGCHSNGANK
ncbi:CIS tube protein [Aliiglaciecola lipolytica]|uniref:Contractile injection system tube protein N-terminal domain-containing protein n=1 Tax=Aliiglaciecola lipolytica E3 TaxID=1127673 RepID=K6YNV2_9ALTE|nr:hypothetical protein [Aliiglaciecola lipolytica]GAC13030.1 hypothetical protein GLIP_0383 [Aliiglaciecola lipolytica E3]